MKLLPDSLWKKRRAMRVQKMMLKLSHLALHRSNRRVLLQQPQHLRHHQPLRMHLVMSPHNQRRKEKRRVLNIIKNLALVNNVPFILAEASIDNDDIARAKSPKKSSISPRYLHKKNLDEIHNINLFILLEKAVPTAPMPSPKTTMVPIARFAWSLGPIAGSTESPR